VADPNCNGLLHSNINVRDNAGNRPQAPAARNFNHTDSSKANERQNQSDCKVDYEFPTVVCS
jgi:hypothetical protein